ncbi:6-aminohexanoate hydrolase [Streptomyces silvensis]|uniref:6-aminohexanoate hydrolase n=2 Tax=Streptomyces silvensis TaxID=1765722 RepID=A0A0W7WSQ9_9ACTN|nr:amidase [Streptomyces silvensis]KUF13609.1 6-aminohexanoate hydrolase [Streptomyces silvensis]
MKLSEYVAYDAVGLAGLVARGEVTAAELETAAMEAVAAVNPLVNAVVETWPCEGGDGAGGGAAGEPLGGVPFLVKDLGVTVAGRRTEQGSRLAAGQVAAADSHLMRRFRAAGLRTFGRTATPEFAYDITTEPVLYGPTRNPWDLGRSAGGSSGGAAAAVAAGIVPVAHGTDAAGSIRIPAASTGLFGLKPTRGRVSMGPDVDEIFNGLAVQGCVSRTVRDSAALLDAVRGPESGDPYTAPEPVRPYADEVARDPGRLRVGVVAQAGGGRRTEGPVAAALTRTADLLAALGHEVSEATLDLGVSWEEYVLANARLWTANLVPWLDGLAAAHGRVVGPATVEPQSLAGYAFGRGVTAADFVRALGVRNIVARGVGARFHRYDVLLTPTLPELPPRIGELAEGVEDLDGAGWIDRIFDRAPFTAVHNVAGTPAMSVPLESDPATGLPVGLQFAAAHGREDVLFRLAGQLERAAPWAHRVPEVRASVSRS